MIRFVLMFLCSTTWAITEFEEDLKTFIASRDKRAMLNIESDVLKEACVPYEFSPKYYEKICFARVLISVVKNQNLEAYRILLSLKSKIPTQALAHDWSALEQEIKDQLSPDQITTVDRNFRYFETYKEYPETYTQDTPVDFVPNSPVLFDSGSDSDRSEIQSSATIRTKSPSNNSIIIEPKRKHVDPTAEVNRNVASSVPTSL